MRTTARVVGHCRLSRDSIPIVRPGIFGDPADRQQHAGHERRAVDAVVPDGQGLPQRAEQHFLVGDESGQSHGMHRHAVDVGATGTGQT